ncbi:MAG: type II secretion system protein E [Acidimicrobiaceae bacterium]|nr:type II secretion system protein E [Acidimicrobiaceae bacterium]
MLDELESELRRVVADEIGSYLSSASSDGRPVPDELDQRQMARSILRRELDNRSRAALRVGELPLSADQEDLLLERVLATAFSPAPGLDPLLARTDVTDIYVNGCDDVRLVTIDGRTEIADPVARTDAELIEMLQTIARRGGHMEREFTPSRPLLDLQLADGSRLAAAAWVTKRPYLTVRRHLLVDADQKDLVARGMYDEGLMSLFAALVRARRNILIAGGQGVGKTTLLRALLHECRPDERIVVLEQEPELHLESSPQRHDHVLVFMERSANTEGVGAVSMADLGRAIKRFTPRRIVVGEVRGPEVIDMLEAMTQGISGSMCTIHADSSWSVFPRLPVYARAGGRDWATSDVLQLAALALDAIIFLARDRTGRRVVAEVRHVQRFDADTGRIVTDEWFQPDPDGRAVRNPTAPIPVALLDDLVDHGYDPTLHDGGRL